ncbi:MAG TPA: thioredoxin domain-containing protein [Candidatus Paceibacterota bacterium]|nr:thioredoxin domain-containing protein [Candidatus Paceibacterota bacterium]
MDNNSSFMERYLTPIAVVVGALIIALAYVYGHGAVTGTTGGTGTQQAPSVDIKDVKTDGDPFIGDASAPVTMAVWFDYQCPFCKQFDTTALPQLYTNYVQTGKLRIVFKDFQFLGQDSLTGAEFARAVWELYPDKFYAWYEAMFNAQDEEGDQGFGDQDSIVAMTKAQVSGIDTDKVVALIAQKKTQYDAAIEADKTEGTTFGINGTPSMIVGTTLLSGAEPYATISQLVDAELAK